MEGTISGPFCQQIDPRFFALFAETSHRIETARDAEEEAAETREDGHFVAFLLDLEDYSVHDVIIVVFFGRLVELFLGVKVSDVVAVGDLDEEGISDRNGEELDMEVYLEESSVLLVRVGHHVYS